MKYLIITAIVCIISLVLYVCFRKLYRFINPPKCGYTMFVIDVGTI